MNIEKQLIQMGDKNRAIMSSRFFKTGKGEYGEGDIFLGIRVPDIRAFAKTKLDTTYDVIESLLTSPYHEVRMCACMILRMNVKRDTKKVFEHYVKHVGESKGINNWDLIDGTAADIVGFYISPPNIEHKERLAFIEKCIKSKDLWVNRVIIVATHYQIKKGNEKMLLYIAPRFLEHRHDLIHKSVGWMLREMGVYCGRDHIVSFIEQYGSRMPRTMLRYAIEHFSKEERSRILASTKF